MVKPSLSIWNYWKLIRTFFEAAKTGAFYYINPGAWHFNSLIYLFWPEAAKSQYYKPNKQTHRGLDEDVICSSTKI